MGDGDLTFVGALGTMVACQRCVILDESALAETPEGAEIEVIWSGGNGPHRYRLHHDAWGSYAVTDGRPPTCSALEFVGVKRFHTRVRLAECHHEILEGP